MRNVREKRSASVSPPSERGPEPRTSMVVRSARAAVSVTHPKPGALRSALDASELSYHLLSRDAPNELYFRAYDCWKDVWQQTFLELDNADRIFSDDFTRQDEVGALFHRDQCVGLTGYRFVDLSRAADRDDSYFKVWTDEAIDKLTAEGARVCVGSNLTVQRDWRGREVGVSIKELLMILSVHRFLASDCDVLAGTMRNGRGMHRLVYRLGARSILSGAIHHGVEVDLVGFYRSALDQNGVARLKRKSAELRLALELSASFGSESKDSA